MPKLNIGVGEEFPLDDAQPPIPLGSGEPPPRGPWYRRGGWHFVLHMVMKLGFVALVVGGLGWLFHSFGAPYAWHEANGLASGPHHFHFPFLPILFLVLLIGFAFRRRHHHGHGHCHRDGGERH